MNTFEQNYDYMYIYHKTEQNYDYMYIHVYHKTGQVVLEEILKFKLAQ